MSLPVKAIFKAAELTFAALDIGMKAFEYVETKLRNRKRSKQQRSKRHADLMKKINEES